MRATPQLLALLPFGLAALLVACSTGAPPIPEPGTSVPAVRATVRVKFPRPRRGHGSLRDPRYVSAATTSVKFTLVSVNGGGIPTGFTATKTVTLAYHASNASCTYSSATQSYTCSTAWVVPAASDTFSVAAYDTSSRELSVNDLTQTIASGNSTIAVTLWGIAKSLTVTTSDASILGSATAGFSLPVTATSYPFSVQAADADGDAIVGPGAPSYSASLTPATNFTLVTPAPSATAFTIKSLNTKRYQAATLTVTAVYPSGGATPYPTSCPSAACSATVSLAAGAPLFAGGDVYGAPSIAAALAGSTGVASSGGQLADAGQMVFDGSHNAFADYANEYVYVYPAASVLAAIGGSYETKVGTLNSFTTVLLYGPLAVDPSGDLVVGTENTNSLNVYSPSALASSLGGSTVSASGTLLFKPNPSSIVISPSGALYALSYYAPSTLTDFAAFTASAVAGAAGGASNSAVGSFTAGSAPDALALSPSGDLFVSNTGGNDVGAYSTTVLASALAGGSSLAQSGSLASGSGPTDMIFDSSGDLFVVDGSASLVSVYSAVQVAKAVAGSTGVAASGSLAVNSTPAGLAIDALGDLFVGSTTYGNQVQVFSAAQIAKALAGSTSVAQTGSLAATASTFAFYP